MNWNLFTKKKKYKKQIFFNFKVLERQSKIRRLFKIPLSPLIKKRILALRFNI